ncbi:MAG: hypothetical protein ABJO09_04275 [Hyphomicrobiales bacterium]|uniref:hypothetical protein n=1 Tax=Nisaea sp. TaxID=2024842 RepID=UPI003299FFA6
MNTKAAARLFFYGETLQKKIGGLVMMVTTDGKIRAENAAAAASQIAELYECSENETAH